MSDATIVAAVFEQMRRAAGEREARQWAAALGWQQVLADDSRRSEIVMAVRLLREGVARVEIRRRLEARGLSRTTALRRVREALVQRGQLRDPGRRDDAGIATCRPAPP